MSRRTPILLVVLLASVTPARPDVVARQGTNVDPEADRQRFESPMIVDLPWASLKELPDGGSHGYAEFLRYWCEDARLVGVRATRDRRGRKGDRIELAGGVQVEESFDRIARIEVVAAIGERVLARAEHARIDAEEEKVAPFRVRLDLAPGALAELDAAGDDAKLVVRLALRDNG
jgi:hypothetical protein